MRTYHSHLSDSSRDTFCKNGVLRDDEDDDDDAINEHERPPPPTQSSSSTSLPAVYFDGQEEEEQHKTTLTRLRDCVHHDCSVVTRRNSCCLDLHRTFTNEQQGQGRKPKQTKYYSFLVPPYVGCTTRKMSRFAFVPTAAPCKRYFPLIAKPPTTSRSFALTRS